MGLTIQNCIIGIQVEAGLRVVFEDLVVRSCSTGMNVSTGAEAAVLSIRRSSFTHLANSIILTAERVTMRVENTTFANNGRSSYRDVNLNGVKALEKVKAGRQGVAYHDHHVKHREVLLHLRRIFDCDASSWDCQRIATVYLLGDGSY